MDPTQFATPSFKDFQPSYIEQLAQRPADSQDPGPWQLYGTTNFHWAIAFGSTMAIAFFVLLCLVLPPLWPLGLIFALVFWIKYARLTTRRKRLIRNW